MRIAVLGHANVGKTTWAAMLTRGLAQAGSEVLAVDGARRPRLAQALGLARAPAAGAGLNAPMRGQGSIVATGPGKDPPFSTESSAGRYGMRHAAQLSAWAGSFEPLGLPGVLLFVLHGEHPETAEGQPCSCPTDLRPRLAEVLARSPTSAVVFDFEAGPQPVFGRDADAADAWLVVIEPYYRALESGARLFELAGARGKPCAIVANKVRSGSGDDAVIGAFTQRRRLPLLAALACDESMFGIPQCIQPSLRSPSAPIDAVLAWCRGQTRAANV